MAVHDFSDLTIGLCGLLELPMPSLEPNEAGTVGFTVVYDGARIGFVQAEGGDAADLLMLVELGPVPPEKELEVLRGLMDANYVMRAGGAPAFTRHPHTQDIVLRYSFKYAEVDVDRLVDSLATAADAVVNWREAHFTLPPPSDGIEFFEPRSSGAGFGDVKFA